MKQIFLWPTLTNKASPWSAMFRTSSHHFFTDLKEAPQYGYYLKAGFTSKNFFDVTPSKTWLKPTLFYIKKHQKHFVSLGHHVCRSDAYFVIRMHALILSGVWLLIVLLEMIQNNSFTDIILFTITLLSSVLLHLFTCT